MTTTEKAFAMDGPLPKDLCSWWEDFFSHERQRSPKASDPWAVFECDLFPLQRKREAEEMLRIADPRGVNRWAARKNMVGTVMEIGADKGGSLYLWCCQPWVRRVIACEIRGTPYAKLFEQRFSYVDFLWLPQSSHDPVTIRQVRDWLDGDSLDVLFVDGDKSYFAEDFLCYSGFMDPDGVTFFHDIQDEAPAAGYARVLQLLPHLKHREVVDVGEWHELESGKRQPRTGYDHWLKLWRGRSCGFGALWMGGGK